jgi:hypothetical protein
MTTATSIYRVGAFAIVATLLVAAPAAATGAAARYARDAAAPPAPNVTAFTITPRRFAVDGVPAPFFYINLDPPLVAPVARLDEPVEVAITIERHGSGGGFSPMGTVYHIAASGMSFPRFNGRVGGRPLAPGAYRASIDAGDDDFAPKHVNFRIVP